MVIIVFSDIFPNRATVIFAWNSVGCNSFRKLLRNILKLLVWVLVLGVLSLVLL